MKGYQLTFFTEANRKHEHTPICEWLLKFAKEHGAIAGTLMGGTEGFDHHGRMHSVHFFEMVDQPLAVTISVEEAACERLMEALEKEPVNLSYVKVAVEFGRIGVERS